MQITLPALVQPRYYSVPAPVPSDLGVGSPLWWVYRLAQRLERETIGYIEKCADGVLVYRVGSAKLQRYYDGQFDLPWIKSTKVAEAYCELLRRSKSNFMRIVADVAAERVNVLGLRLPGDDEPADSDTWGIWTRNDMPFWFPVAVQTALVQRRAYWSVWWAGENVAKIALEDPQQCIVEHDPNDRNRRAAALKLWVDDWTGETHANLYLPTETHYFAWTKSPAGLAGWYPRKPAERNPLGVVPIVPMVNKPGLHGRGASRIEDVLDAQDRINQTLANEQVAEYLSAFRQKWATGLEIPTDEEGKPIQVFEAALEALWVSPEAQSRFGQFDATDLSNYWQAIEGNLEHISVLTRTPRHAFVHQGQAPSGDALKSDEAGLVADVKGMRSPFGSALREVLRLARQIEKLATPADSEIVWADPEWQTLGQLVDAQVKMLSTVPPMISLDYAREQVGMTPATIKRVRAEILRDQLEREAFAPEPEVSADGAGSDAEAAG